MKKKYEIMTNEFEIIEIESKQDLVKKYGDTFKNLDEYLIWESGKYPIKDMQGIMIKGCLEDYVEE